MENNQPPCAVEPYTAEREWEVDGVPVLSASLTLPRPVEQRGKAARRISRFYRLQARTYLRYCEAMLFPIASEQYRQALADSTPLPHCTAALTYCVTCCERGLLSLHTDMRECVGGKPEVLRRGDTWNLAIGCPVPLSDFFPPRYPVRKKLILQAGEEIRRQESAGIARYHENWRQDLRKTYSPENYYVCPDGIRYFWQMYSIAPSAEGIPTFCLPFSQGGCRWPLP